ncbi:MAG: hypothetical protein ACM3X6_05915 [Patescibacteria group bacterium]
MADSFLKNSIIAVMQTVADFLATPSTFTATQANLLIQTLEGLRGSIQNLPVNAVIKADLNNRLTSIEGILLAFASGTSGLTAFEVLTAVLGLLDLLNEKIEALNLPVRCGALTVNFPCQFSTAQTCICPSPCS